SVSPPRATEHSKPGLRETARPRTAFVRAIDCDTHATPPTLTKHDGATMLVGDIHASPERRFTVTRFSTLGMNNTLQNKPMVQETGKDTRVVSLTFTGEDREQIRRILDSITRNYLQHNVERKSEEAAKSLAFLGRQLPEVRNRLDVAENKLNAFRQDKDSVDLPLEAKAVLDSMVNIDAQLNELTFKE
ncbi:hypothetical protein ACU7M1_32240, partial [Burkholderia pseudomallei]